MKHAPMSQRLPTALTLAFAAMLALAAVAVAKPAHRQGAHDCGARAKQAKKHQRAGCHGASKRHRVRVVRRRFRLAVPGGEGLSRVVSVHCPRHRKAVGGGVEVTQPNLTVVLSVPDDATSGWLAQLANLSPSGAIQASFTVYAICA